MMRRGCPILRNYTMMTTGALLAALALDFFMAPNNVVTGGAMLLHTCFGTPLGLLTPLVNIPLWPR